MSLPGDWNRVPGYEESHPGWHYGLCVLERDGSLFGRRTVELIGPNGERIPFESTKGWAPIHAAAAEFLEGLASRQQ